MAEGATQPLQEPSPPLLAGGDAHQPTIDAAAAALALAAAVEAASDPAATAEAAAPAAAEAAEGGESPQEHTSEPGQQLAAAAVQPRPEVVGPQPDGPPTGEQAHAQPRASWSPLPQSQGLWPAPAGPTAQHAAALQRPTAPLHPPPQQQAQHEVRQAQQVQQTQQAQGQQRQQRQQQQPGEEREATVLSPPLLHAPEGEGQQHLSRPEQLPGNAVQAQALAASLKRLKGGSKQRVAAACGPAAAALGATGGAGNGDRVDTAVGPPEQAEPLAGTGTWHWRVLPATAFLICGRLGFSKALFEALARRPLEEPLDKLECLEEATGRALTLRVAHDASARCGYVRRSGGFGEFLKSSGCQPGDLLALRRSGHSVLLRRVPAAEAQAFVQANPRRGPQRARRSNRQQAQRGPGAQAERGPGAQAEEGQEEARQAGDEQQARLHRLRPRARPEAKVEGSGEEHKQQQQERHQGRGGQPSQAQLPQRKRQAEAREEQGNGQPKQRQPARASSPQRQERQQEQQQMSQLLQQSQQGQAGEHAQLLGELGFMPVTPPSVLRALAADLPAGRVLHHVRGRASEGGSWAAECHKPYIYLGRLPRQPAAVTADLILTWRHLAADAPGLPARLNFSEAGYSNDQKLTTQLRAIETPGQLTLFLQALFKQNASHRGKRLHPAPAGGQGAAPGASGRAPKRQRQQSNGTAAGASSGAAAAGATGIAPAAGPGMGAEAASDRLLALRRFAARCASLFPGMHLPPDLGAADWDLLSAVLAAELGAEALGGLEDGRDEWQLLADLLAAASGAAVSRQQAQGFFPPPAPGAPAAPDFLALWSAGLYTAAWPLPLRPPAVRRVQREQQARQRPAAGFGPEYVGVRVSHHWRRDDSWYCGQITGVDSRGRFDISYDDGDKLQAVDPSTEPLLFLDGPLTAAAAAPARWQAAAVRVKAEPGVEAPHSHAPAATAAAAAAAAGTAPARRAPPATPTWRPVTLAAATAEVSDARGQPHPARRQQGQQQLPTPSPAGKRPAGASKHCQPSIQAAGSEGVAAALAAQRAQLAERKKQEARAALCGSQAADPGAAGLAALRCLALARAGGPRLRAAVAGWVSLSAEQQQEVYEALVLCSSEEEDWAGVEEALALLLP